MNTSTSSDFTGLHGWVPIIVRYLSLALACIVLCQCAPVHPWQRGKLAEYSMRPDRDPLALTLGEHVFFSREAATGGRGIGGGGCGCN
ncbi:MAG: DUF4266 domain-containing protein [Verrucomicrobiaceae bacterium]|nr:DUF4266 domain-containing protein [Verrucomicrobiaceae bacterium]